MPETIPCLPLRQLTDGPLFSAGPGTLSSLTNMEIQAGGYCEARGGLEEMKPNGGTGADAITTGGFGDALQVSSSYGWIRTETPGGVFTGNKQFDSGWYVFGAVPAAGAKVYFGADLPFSRLTILLGSIMGAGPHVFAYEYWNGAAWTALTTAETFSFLSLAPIHASWTMPTDWATTTIGDAGTGHVNKYWMRIRVVSVTAPTTTSCQWVQGNWVGMRELYVMTHDPRTLANGGSLKRYDQTGTTAEWYSIDSTLLSGNASPPRSAAYRGRLFMVNGKEQKRWDGIDFVDIGLPAFAATATVGPATAGAGVGAGIYRWYVAWGYGPIQSQDQLNYQVDPICLYGPGQATYAGTELTVVAATEIVPIAITGTIPADVNAAYIYRTPDLTNVAAAQRPNFPAFLIGALWRNSETTNPVTALVNLGVFSDFYAAPMFPQTEAIVYNNLPPKRQKYVAVYQNRLFMGDDNYWYWSQPFQPDAFNRVTDYVPLAKATGGRHMGGIEFADQMVLFTEDQTWGLTNVDLDVPQLFPIALGVGCIAPDAACVVDGLLIWPARDGFYAWDGGRQGPKKISDKMETTFGKMSFDTHGGSKATGHSRRYDIRISDPQYSSIGAAFRYSLDSGEWSTYSPTGFSGTLFPLATIYAPLGNNDAGALHPLWGKVDYTTSASEYTLFLSELGTTDNGSAYTCSGSMHFPLPPGRLFVPGRVVAYYQATNGWGTPAFGFVPADVIGSSVGTLNTGTPDTGTDYSIVGGTFSQVGRGTSDLKISFSVASVAGGTVNGQRLFGAILEGKSAGIRRGGI